MKPLHYSLFVLIGACSYGVHASIVKLGFGAGFSIYHITVSQYLLGFLMLLLLYFFSPKAKMKVRQTLSLFSVGLLVCITGIFYGLSLERVSAAIAVVMLFQFTWIGVLIEAIYLKKLPSRKKILSVAVLWIGTVLAGGIGSSTGFDWRTDWDGILYGFIAAITFALFIFFSGKVAIEIPTMQRSLMIAVGGLIFLLFLFKPTFIIDGTVITSGLWKYGLLLGLFGTILPILFFAIGTPHLESGISTIVGAAELPAAVIAAMIILHELVTPLQGLGVLLILIGIVIPQYNGRRRRRVKSVL
ncbi:drug/metabolite transporter (DMT)-like permease [Bacillus pakistanensis]|uniref:Drug/metabolite transporter (DMT)-like permease n=1 Tax=Rossellomorea pakistanensis TaxID=992288 RepID=A0ABS2NJ98_9BACI|nr:DMT family transporter [Bacillus pakistanensis]MBM7587942.1 drug/metabolite transporter (DMT)-like permease [Bacillus pakistanensis]